MSPRFPRRYLNEENFLEIAYYKIDPDPYRTHGWRFRLAWIQNGTCRVLYDNHHGKPDHCHIDGLEYPYAFSDVDQLIADFVSHIRRLGGPI